MSYERIVTGVGCTGVDEGKDENEYIENGKVRCEKGKAKLMHVELDG